MGNTNINVKKKAIEYYYYFHKKIELIFTTGFNPFFKYEKKNNFLFSKGNIKEEEFYIFDEKWINLWKNNSGYNIAKKYLDKIELKEEKELEKDVEEMCNNMVLTGEINNFTNNKIPKMDNERAWRPFLNKIIYELSDFDCLVDERTFNLFTCLYGNDYSGNLLDPGSGYFVDDKTPTTRRINGRISDKMIYFSFKDQNIIKLIYESDIEEEKKLLQLTLDFNCNDEKKEKKGILSLFKSDESQSGFSEYIINELGKKKADELINFYNNAGVCNNTETRIKININGNKYDFKIINANLSLKNLKSDLKKKKIISSNINNVQYVGLENVGATCYMNATLQCLVNTDLLTRYLLIEENYNNIMDNIELCELTSNYVEILVNVCLEENNNKYYKPEKFKKIISKKNPLFSGIQAND